MNILKKNLQVFLTVLAIAAPLTTQAREFGLGVIFGEPTGITGKWWSGNHDAIDAGLSYSFREYMLIYADKLWHFPGALSGKDEFTPNLSPYVGVGGGIYLGSKRARVSARIPLGLEWLPQKPTLGVFLELVPALRVVPEVAGEIGGGIGARYYF